jgi:hypothetical protein
MILADSQLSNLVIWSDSSKSNRIFTLEDGHKPSIAAIGSSPYIEAEIVAPKGQASVGTSHVSVLLNNEKYSAHVVGAHPSLQIQMKPSDDNKRVYTASIDLGSKREADPSGSVYSMTLLVADTSNSTRLPMGKFEIGSSDKRSVHQSGVSSSIPELSAYQPKSKIDHRFKEPPVGANSFHSTVFTGIVCIIPVLLFLFGTKRLDFNLKGLATVTSTAFFGGLGIYGLIIAMFFLTWTLVQTVAAAVILACGLCFVGNRMLRDVRASGELEGLE